MRNQYIKLQGKDIKDDISDEVFDEANDFDEWVVNVNQSSCSSSDVQFNPSVQSKQHNKMYSGSYVKVESLLKQNGIDIP